MADLGAMVITGLGQCPTLGGGGGGGGGKGGAEVGGGKGGRGGAGGGRGGGGKGECQLIRHCQPQEEIH